MATSKTKTTSTRKSPAKSEGARKTRAKTPRHGAGEDKGTGAGKMASRPKTLDATDLMLEEELKGLVAPTKPDRAPDPAPDRSPVRGVTRPPAGDPAQKGDSPASENTAAGADAPQAPDDKLVKKDLIDRVVARSGVKPRYARQVTEAMLVELGAMLEEADILQLAPLGNMRVQRRKAKRDGEVIILKLKRKKDQPKDIDPLAAAAE